jgi:hypothetical protein
VRRRTVQIKVVLLHILAIVALAVGETKHPFLQNRVFSIPEGERETENLMFVANPAYAVLAPMIRTRPGLIMAKIVPGIAVTLSSLHIKGNFT